MPQTQRVSAAGDLHPTPFPHRRGYDATDPSTAACPDCGAAVGQPCHHKHSARAAQFHESRRKAARRSAGAHAAEVAGGRSAEQESAAS